MKAQPITPPLGIIPEVIWKETRAKGLSRAMKRYRAAGIKPLPAWTAEYNKLKSEIEDLRKQPI